MIGMLINALYNLVDAYFIGGLGESQMGAISIAFPLGQVVVGLGSDVWQWCRLLLIKTFRAREIGKLQVKSPVLHYTAVFVLAQLLLSELQFLKPILTMLGATDTIMPYALLMEESMLFHVFSMYLM